MERVSVPFPYYKKR